MGKFYTDFADAEVFEGGQALRHVHSSSGNHRVLSWDDPGSHADVDVVMQLTFSKLDDNETLGIIVRGDYISGDEYGIFCAIRENRAMYMRYYDDTTGGFGSSDLAQHGDDPEAMQRWWLRFRVEGSSLKARRWLHGEDEPSSWDIDITEASAPMSAGWVGIYALNGQSNDNYVDYFAVDADGGSAPLPGESVGSDQWATDFSGDTEGSAPSDWTEEWQTSSSTWTVVDDADVLPPLDWPSVWADAEWGVVDDAAATGGAKLRDDSSSGNDHRALRWDEAGEGSDQEIVARLRTTSDSATFRHQSRLYVRGFGGAGSESGYYAELNGGLNRLHLRKLNGGSETILDESSSDVWEVDEWMWLRLRAEGDAIKARVWKDADPEPLWWDVEVTDTALTSGWVGVGSYNNSGTRDFDVVGVGTGGDSAPVEPHQPPDDVAASFADGEVSLTWTSDADEFTVRRQRWVGEGAPA